MPLELVGPTSAFAPSFVSSKKMMTSTMLVAFISATERDANVAKRTNVCDAERKNDGTPPHRRRRPSLFPSSLGVGEEHQKHQKVVVELVNYLGVITCAFIDNELSLESLCVRLGRGHFYSVDV